MNMTNAELDQAIKTVHSLLRTTPIKSKMADDLEGHLESLLVIQLNRALPEELNVASLTDATNLSRQSEQTAVKVQCSKPSYSGPVPA